jgi:carbamoylphosphate synthase large subunit
VVVLDGNEKAFVSSWRDIVFKHVNFGNYEQVKSVAIAEKPDMVYAPCNEIGNLICAKLALELCLTYNSLETVSTSLNKHMQRDLFGENEFVFSPKYMIFNENIEQIESRIGYPIVVKPNSSSGSRGVSQANDRSEFLIALNEANLYLGLKGQILIEEFIEGEQISVETVSLNGTHLIVGITLEILSGAPYFIERSHVMSPEIYEKYFKKIEAPVYEILSKLNVKVGPCHIELKVSDDKVSLIEIATRSGGWRDDLLKYAGCEDYNELVISSYLSINACSNFDFLPKKQSLVNIMLHPKDLKSTLLGAKDGVLKQFHMNQKPPVWKPQNLIDAFGYAFFSSDNSLKKYTLK